MKTQQVLQKPGVPTDLPILVRSLKERKVSNTYILTASAFITGALVPFQLAFNAQLGGVTKSPYTAGLIIFLIGAAAMAIAVVLTRQPLPSIQEFARAPATIWLGGLIATLYILAIVILTPKLGVGTTATLVITGQVLMALVLDHFGAFGNPLHQMNWHRFVGAALMVAGVVAIQSN